MTLGECRLYLRGWHPSVLGIQPVAGRTGKAARYDRVAVDRCIDRLSGITESAHDTSIAGSPSVEEAELDRLRCKVESARSS